MKNKKFHKKEIKTNTEDVSHPGNGKRKISVEKVKYRHKNYWLQEDDVDFELTKYQEDEEEE
jgi:hypothetical protein